MWFVIYSPGLGGNHLLNVINTDPAMEADIDFIMSRYQPDVTSAFAIDDAVNHFHHSPGSNHTYKTFENYQSFTRADVRNLFEKGNKAACAHLAEYVNVYYDQDTSAQKHLIIDLPKIKRSDNLAWQRWMSYSLKMMFPGNRDENEDEDSFNFNDVAWLQHEYLWYSPDILNRLIPQNDMFRIPSEIVFSRYGDTVCEWFFDNTDLKPNPELVRTMQSKFFQECSQQVQDRLARYREAKSANFNRYDD